MGFGKYGLVFWVMSTMCLIEVSIEFQPLDNYLIDCGSPTNSSVGDRVFLGETSNHSFLSHPDQASPSVSASNSLNLSSIYGSSLYQTARVLDTTSNYTFPIKQHGRHFVRLYLFPFVANGNGKLNLSSAKFSVFAQGFTLLRNFQPHSTPVVKEYCLDISSNSLVITFVPLAKSFAFVNALEVISLPDEVIPGTAQTIEVPRRQENLTARALETVERVNMGNQMVSPDNDTLWRQWVPDSTYLMQINLFQFVSNISIVNYTVGGPTRNVAPPSVYGTATKVDSSNPSTSINMTWHFEVDPGFEYLVRFHFCDIIEPAPENIFFSVYINSLSVAKDLNLGNRTSNVWGAPYYVDAVTGLIENSKLNVSVGTSSVFNALPDAILNGLEILKISNSKGSLDEVRSSASSSKLKVWVIAASVVGLLLVVVILVFVLYRRNRRKSSHMDRSTKEDWSANGTIYTKESAIFSRSKIGYQFPFIAVQEATDRFSESLVIGVGGFGKVYKGVLSDGTKVAVKRGASQSHQGLAEFRTEVEMLSQFRHRHLVSLIGYCDERDEMIIIYEYMENGTLKSHLYGSDLLKLNWRQRLEICIGSARGLHYLHTGSSKAIIHRDVKSANILLDENLMAKVADFGLSKNGPEIDQSHVSTAVKGSFGYLDPEYMTRQQLTEKSDVYSFGVVMFEVLCGRPVIDPSRPREMVNLMEWVRESKKRGELEKVIDSHVAGKMKMESLKKFTDIAEKCLAEQGIDRPTMGDVLWNLECALQLEGIEEKSPTTGSDSSNNHLENDASSTQFTMGSAVDIAGISMSRVFSEMVKGEKPEMR